MSEDHYDEYKALHTPMGVDRSKQSSAPPTGSTADAPRYSADELVKRAMRNAKARQAGDSPRWVAVMDTFGTGSTVARNLCVEHGLDPDEPVPGVHCIACEP